MNIKGIIGFTCDKTTVRRTSIQLTEFETSTKIMLYLYRWRH